MIIGRVRRKGKIRLSKEKGQFLVEGHKFKLTKFTMGPGGRSGW